MCCAELRWRTVLFLFLARARQVAACARRRSAWRRAIRFAATPSRSSHRLLSSATAFERKSHAQRRRAVARNASTRRRARKKRKPRHRTPNTHIKPHTGKTNGSHQANSSQEYRRQSAAQARRLEGGAQGHALGRRHQGACVRRCCCVRSSVRPVARAEFDAPAVDRNRIVSARARLRCARFVATRSRRSC